MRRRVWGFVGASLVLPVGCSTANGSGNGADPGSVGGAPSGSPDSGGTFSTASGGIPSTGTGGASPTANGGSPFGGATAGTSGGASTGAGGTPPSNGGAPPVEVCGEVFKDCNGDPSDSCEANVHSDANNCGDCGNVCPPAPNASPSCFVKECDFFCNAHFGDCDANPENGCEVDLTSDNKNCGLCGNDCGDNACQNGGCECASTSVTAEEIPLDIYILFDQSQSMTDAVTGGTKWDVIKAALVSFVQAPAAEGISIGLGYFPFNVADPPLPCFVDEDCGEYAPCAPAPFGGVCTKADACNPENYANDVPIDLLPGAATAIVDSLNAHAPEGFTPTYPAIQGSLQYVQGWAQSHADHKTVLVLATDGDPTTCDPGTNNVDSIATALIAPAAAASPQVLTFVIGVGSSLTSLNQIAASGGTQQAFIVDTAGNDPGGEFLAAMEAIKNSVLLGCQYQIPAPPGGEPIDYSKVNVRYTPAAGAEKFLRNVPNAAACAASDDGWYYDNPTTPTQINLCDTACGTLKGGGSATIEVLLGCATIG